MKLLVLAVFVLLSSVSIIAQPSFFDAQKKYPRVASAMKQKEDTLKRRAASLGLDWPIKQMYVRSFKYDSQLEVWARNNSSEPYKLFKTYKVCAMAGSLGPKRIEGDYQVPEGCYYITEFNPKSEYNMSLKLNYPNESDKLLSDSLRPGGGIYIHGSCITVGCIPIMDEQIAELYVIAASAKSSGQDFIPVHIFPIRYNNKPSVEYLNKVSRGDSDLQKFAVKMKEIYDYFEKEKRLPLIAVNGEGEYVFTM